MHSWCRVTVEHLFGQMKKFGILCTIFRARVIGWWLVHGGWFIVVGSLWLVHGGYLLELSVEQIISHGHPNPFQC